MTKTPEASVKTLDVRGEICPYPMMRTVSALKKLHGDGGHRPPASLADDPDPSCPPRFPDRG